MLSVSECIFSYCLIICPPLRVILGLIEFRAWDPHPLPIICPLFEFFSLHFWQECIRVILWDEAATLWEAPEQPVLDPGWTDWKGPAFDELTLPEDDIPVPADKTSRPFSSLSITPSPAQEKQYTGAKRGRKPKDRSVQSQHLASATRVTTRKQVKVETRNDAGPSSSAAMVCA